MLAINGASDVANRPDAAHRLQEVADSWIPGDGAVPAVQRLSATLDDVAASPGDWEIHASRWTLLGVSMEPFSFENESTRIRVRHEARSYSTLNVYGNSYVIENPERWIIDFCSTLDCDSGPVERTVLSQLASERGERFEEKSFVVVDGADGHKNSDQYFEYVWTYDDAGWGRDP